MPTSRSIGTTNSYLRECFDRISNGVTVSPYDYVTVTKEYLPINIYLQAEFAESLVCSWCLCPGRKGEKERGGREAEWEIEGNREKETEKQREREKR